MVTYGRRGVFACAVADGANAIAIVATSMAISKMTSFACRGPSIASLTLISIPVCSISVRARIISEHLDAANSEARTLSGVSRSSLPHSREKFSLPNRMVRRSGGDRRRLLGDYDPPRTTSRERRWYILPPRVEQRKMKGARSLNGARRSWKAMMTNEYAFEMTTSAIRVGAGVTGEVGAELADLGKQHVLVLTDPNLRAQPPVGRVLESLETHKIRFSIFDRVRGGTDRRIIPRRDLRRPSRRFRRLRRGGRRFNDRYREGC
ncbi:MAG TPA: iron-containing alcohol dehydrogenase [Terriglobia bacterium]|nr:iron-containing alcohol dehydrogenase [Terriglobia bacterium]